MINGQLTHLWLTRFAGTLDGRIARPIPRRIASRELQTPTCVLVQDGRISVNRQPQPELRSLDAPGLIGPHRIPTRLGVLLYLRRSLQYKQVIGLPMCFVPTGLMASMVCFTYEISYTARVLYRLLKEGGYARVRSRPRARLFRHSATTLH